MQMKFVSLFLLSCICSTGCTAADPTRTGPSDYFAVGSSYQQRAQYLPAIVNFQQAMRSDKTRKEALQRAEVCAREFQSMKSWPDTDRITVNTIARELNLIEQDWNKHDIQAEMAHYDDNYMDNDGFSKTNMMESIRQIWKTCADSRSQSTIAGLAVQGDCAVVQSVDKVGGYTEIMPKMGTGKLEYVNHELLFLRRVDNTWKIIGRAVESTDTTVTYGKSRSVTSELECPGEVRQDGTFSATSKQTLPAGTLGVGSITSRILEYPLPAVKDVWRALNKDGTMQRELSAPSEYKNFELITTVGLENATRTLLTGLQFRARRINVIPANPI